MRKFLGLIIFVQLAAGMAVAGNYGPDPNAVYGPNREPEAQASASNQNNPPHQGVNSYSSSNRSYSSGTRWYSSLPSGTMFSETKPVYFYPLQTNN